MAEPVYERDGSGIVVRVISLVMAGVFIWTCLDSTSLRSGRLIALPLIPLAMIWYPETIAGYLGDGFTPTLISRVAWVVLGALMVQPILFWLV